MFGEKPHMIPNATLCLHMHTHPALIMELVAVHTEFVGSSTEGVFAGSIDLVVVVFLHRWVECGVVCCDISLS